MNNENLSREEAEIRAKILTVESYDVHIDLTHAADQNFTSYPTATTVRFSAQNGAETFIDYIHHSIDSIKLNGIHLNTHEAVNGSRIHLPNLSQSNLLTIMGRSYFSHSGEGLHRYIDPSDGRVYLYTQYEPADCRRVFPVFEQPNLKAVFNFRVTAPRSWVVSSNAELEREIEDPADSAVTKRVFKPSVRISTYVTALLAGEYFAAHDTYVPSSSVNSGPLPLVAYCRQSLKDHFDYDNIFTITKQGLDYFQQLFDYPYPYPKYEQAFVPEYNLGAMENPGLVTFTEKFIFESGATQAQLEQRANVICHEMSHMWFGNLVTMKWWDDLWLKESFAEYMGTLGAKEANHFEQAWVTFANSRKAWAYAQDQLPTTHPIVSNIPHLEAARQNFDGITYAKGSAVLKQLAAYVGFDTFIAAIRIYFKRHEWGNTTLHDFLLALDEASEQDIFSWAQAWLQTSGLTELYLIHSRNSPQVSATIAQVLPEQVPAEVGRPHRLKVETFTEENQKLLSAGIIEAQIPAGNSPLTKLDLSKREEELIKSASLVVLNAEDLTYAKVVLRENDGLATALKLIFTIDNPLSRGLIWGSLWNLVRDARLVSSRYIQAIENSLETEQSATLLANLLNQAQGAIFSYSSLQQRQELIDSLYLSVVTALESARPSSDRQLILVRALLAISAHTPLGIKFAQSVCCGITDENHPDIPHAPGLVYNQTLGWAALIALAAQGQVDTVDLESARRRRPTAIAERGYAFARAALPSKKMKEKAFRAVLEDTALSNEILTATAQGFQLGTRSLLEQFIEPYFSSLENIWQTQSIGMATRIVNGLFPHVDYQNDQTIEQHPVIISAKDWLDKNEGTSSALRRLIIEHLDRSYRALRAQQYSSLGGLQTYNPAHNR